MSLSGKVDLLVGAFVLGVDCVPQEQHSFKAQVTKYPVEDGSTRSDNIYNEPPVITVNGFVTNTPLIQNLSIPLDDVKDAFDLLMQIRAAKIPVTLITGLARYENMVLADLDFPRDAKTGDTLRFSSRFEQIEVTNSQTVTLPRLRAGKVADQGETRDGGKQGATKVEPPTRTGGAWLEDTGKSVGKVVVRFFSP